MTLKSTWIFTVCFLVRFQDNLEKSQILSQFIADCVFYASLNFVGFYLRLVNEINMRRGFLDKRSSIETTFKLKYEKEKEVGRQQLSEYNSNLRLSKVELN